MKRKIIILLAACVAAAPLQAQNLEFGGLTYNNDLMMSTDFAALSRSHPFGTARVMGMGGAFTSLGADLSSMSINPAGLGMYRRNEFSLTPLLSVAHGQTQGAPSWVGNNKTRFAFANVGVALNVFESPASPLTSLTLGIGMNRIADFNTRYSFSSESRYDPSKPDQLMPTIADVFGQQLGQDGIFPDDKGNLGYNWNPWYWPAILGYNGYLISDVGGQWVPDCIGRNASVVHSMDVVSQGSINEFAVSMGANFNNVVYVGATIGICSVYKKVGMTYQEEYGYFDANGHATPAVDKNGTPLNAQLDYMSLYQESKIDGSGVDFKLGVIVRPVAGLRVGVAFHTPTYYWLDRSYRADIESHLINNKTEDDQYNFDSTPRQDDIGGNSWDFVSPSRLLFGASYTFGNLAIVSVDYEREWYNGIRVKNVPEGADFHPEAYKAEFKNNYKGTNTLRAGVEVRPLPIFAVRLGGGYTDSMFKDRQQYYNSPSVYESYYITGGLGINLGRNTVLDVAYQNVTEKQTPYELFFSKYQNGGEMKTYSGLYDTKQTRHYISMTLGFRF